MNPSYQEPQNMGWPRFQSEGVEVTTIDGDIVDDNNDTILGTITVTFEQTERNEIEVHKFIFVRWADQKEPEFDKESNRLEGEREMLREYWNKKGLTVKFRVA